MKSETVEVSLQIRAIDFGYIKGRMIHPGTVFPFKGTVKLGQGLAPWMEAVDPEELERQLAPKKAAPVKEEVNTESGSEEAELTPAQKAAATRARKKAEAEAAAMTLDV